MPLLESFAKSVLATCDVTSRIVVSSKLFWELTASGLSWAGSRSDTRFCAEAPSSTRGEGGGEELLHDLLLRLFSVEEGCVERAGFLAITVVVFAVSAKVHFELDCLQHFRCRPYRQQPSAPGRKSTLTTSLSKVNCPTSQPNAGKEREEERVFRCTINIDGHAHMTEFEIISW